MSSSQTIQIIVLAGIAIFLILRLRGVLGTRDGFEPTEPVEMAAHKPRLEVVENPQDEAEDDITAHVDAASPAATALRAMRQVEPGFGVGDFLGGARQAYEMILMAFHNGDLTPVRNFLGDQVADAFQQVIDTRKERGETTEAQFLGTRETSLITAHFEPATRDAEITIRFVGELIEAVRDKDGEVVSGDPRKGHASRDTWTFGRRMGEADPNWRLIATG